MEIIDITNLNLQEVEITNIDDCIIETMDIEVPNGHHYVLSSGIISHNSVSTLTQTTSGIEPVFMTSYKRRRKLNPNDHETKVGRMKE